MSQFRGYAQKSSVQSNIIKLPDTSEKILQESRRYLQQWSKVSQQDQSKRETYLAQLESNFKKEEQERLTNRKLRQHYADDFKEALDYNHKVKIDGAAKAADAQQKRAREMAAFSQTLAKGLTNIAQGYVQDRQEYGKNLAIQYDISESDVKHLRTLDGRLEDYEGKNNELINELLSKGASFERINQIKNLSGWSMRGLREGEVVRAADNYEGYYYSKYLDPIERPNGLPPMSLAQADEMGDTVALQQLQGIVAGQYWNQPGLKHVSNNQISQHASEKIALVHGRSRTYLHQKMIKDAREAADNQFKDILATKFKTGGWKAVFDMTALQAGKTGFATAEAKRHKATVELFQSGVLNEVHLNEAKVYMMEPRDGGKPVLWHQRNHRKMFEYEKAFRTYENERASIRDVDRVRRVSEEKAEAEAVRSDIISNWENIPNVGMFLMNEYKKAGPNTHLQKMYLELQGLAQGSEMKDKMGEPILWDLLNKKTLTRGDVLRMKLSPQKTNEWLKRADAASPFTFTKDEQTVITNQASTIVEDILKQYGAEGKSVSSSSLTKFKIKRELGNYFKQGLLKDMGRLDAIAWAKQQVDKDIADGVYDIVERKLIRKDGREITVQSPEFKLFAPGIDNTREPYPYSNIKASDIAANPDLISTTPIFPRKVVEDYFNGLKHHKHNLPPAVVHFVTTKVPRDPETGAPLITPQQLLEAQAEAQGIETLGNTETIEEANLSKIPPEYHKSMYTAHATKEGTLGILTYLDLIPQPPNVKFYKQQLVDSYTGSENPYKFSESALEMFRDMGGGK